MEQIFYLLLLALVAVLIDLLYDKMNNTKVEPRDNPRLYHEVNDNQESFHIRARVRYPKNGKTTYRARIFGRWPTRPVQGDLLILSDVVGNHPLYVFTDVDYRKNSLEFNADVQYYKTNLETYLKQQNEKERVENETV